MDILPSFLMPRSESSNYGGGLLDNNVLRMGEVQEIVLVNDKRNLNKNVTEYRVLVQHKSNGTAVTKMYDHCILVNTLGSLADKETWTLRADPSAKMDNSKTGVGRGSKVLILCINGESNNAVIIGGIRDATDHADKDLKGHHSLRVFNGISTLIDTDGQLIVTYGGKTEIDGTTKVDASKTGSALSLLQNGNITLGDKDLKNALTIDHENSKVSIARDSAFELGAATDKMLLGQSFRDAQKQMNNKIKSYSDTAKNLLQNAGQALTTASVKNAVPVTGGAGSAGDFAQAGSLLIAASQVMGQIAQAIGDFEQTASAVNSFLSKRNSSD